jgi:hypothetical protein
LHRNNDTTSPLPYPCAVTLGRWFVRTIALTLAVGTAFSLLVGGPSRAGDPDLSWPPSTLGAGDIGFIIEDAWMLQSAIRVLTPGWQPMCDSLEDVRCTELAAQRGWWILRVAPPCAAALAWEECIEEVSLAPRNGPPRELEYVGQVPGSTFPADEARGLPTGSTMSLFRDPASPDQSQGYAAYLGGQMGGQIGGLRNPFRLGTFAAQVIPYRLVPSGQEPSGGQCLWRQAGECAYRTDFPEEVAVRMSVRLSNVVTGWLGGRLIDPSIEVESLSNDLNRLTVTAAPVDVPLVAVAIPKASATPEILEYWRTTFTCPDNELCGVTSGQSSGPHGADQLRLFSDFLGDTANKVVPTWSISNLLQSTPQPCLSDRTRLIGLVTTNATVYGAAPPEFQQGVLRYSVAALHRVPGGEVLSGSYDLVLRSDVARCLYGFSKAPISASISVTSDDGTEQVATTSVSERDGWLHLAAYGFHFSQPTISVRLTSQAPTKKTIMCKKGSKMKKVVGVRPSCPVGWRLIRR